MKSKEKRYSTLKILGALFLFIFQYYIYYLLLEYLDIRFDQFGGLLIFLEVLAVIVIVNQKMESMYKIAWTTFVLLVPIFGLMIYLGVKLDKRQKKIADNLDMHTKLGFKNIDNQSDNFKELNEKCRSEVQLANYLYNNQQFPVYKNEGLKYYDIGEKAFADLLKELNKATKFIFLEYFIVEKGIMYDSLVSILKKKASEGVEVRFLIDGSNEFNFGRNRIVEELKSYGINAKTFMPIKLKLSFYMNHRDHRKLVIIDGKVGFTGGFNIADEYINAKKRFGHWKDVGIRFSGKVVDSYTTMFLSMWNWDSEIEVSQYRKYINQEQEHQYKDGHIIGYSDNPFDDLSTSRRTIIHTLQNAHDYVWFTTPYLIIDEILKEEIVYAVSRGVDVRIVMPHIPDKKTVFFTSRSYYLELLQAGVKIYEYIPGFVHAKLLISDDIRATVSTVNLDYRSLFLHFECGLYIYNGAEIEDIKKDFLDMFDKSTNIDINKYYLFPLWQRVIGRMVRIVAPLM